MGEEEVGIDARSLRKGSYSAWLKKTKSDNAKAKWFSGSTKRYFTIDFDTQTFFYSHSVDQKKISQPIPFRDILGAERLPPPARAIKKGRGTPQSSGFVLKTRERNFELHTTTNPDAAQWVYGLNAARDLGLLRQKQPEYNTPSGHFHGLPQGPIQILQNTAKQAEQKSVLGQPPEQNPFQGPPPVPADGTVHGSKAGVVAASAVPLQESQAPAKIFGVSENSAAPSSASNHQIHAPIQSLAPAQTPTEASRIPPTYAPTSFMSATNKDSEKCGPTTVETQPEPQSPHKKVMDGEDAFAALDVLEEMAGPAPQPPVEEDGCWEPEVKVPRAVPKRLPKLGAAPMERKEACQQSGVQDQANSSAGSTACKELAPTFGGKCGGVPVTGPSADVVAPPPAARVEIGASDESSVSRDKMTRDKVSTGISEHTPSESQCESNVPLAKLAPQALASQQSSVPMDAQQQASSNAEMPVQPSGQVKTAGPAAVQGETSASTLENGSVKKPGTKLKKNTTKSKTSEMEVASSTTSVSQPSASPAPLVPGPCDARIEGISQAASPPPPPPPPPSAPPQCTMQERDLHVSRNEKPATPQPSIQNSEPATQTCVEETAAPVETDAMSVPLADPMTAEAKIRQAHGSAIHEEAADMAVDTPHTVPPTKNTDEDWDSEFEEEKPKKSSAESKKKCVPGNNDQQPIQTTDDADSDWDNNDEEKAPEVEKRTEKALGVSDEDWDADDNDVTQTNLQPSATDECQAVATSSALAEDWDAPDLDNDSEQQQKERDACGAPQHHAEEFVAARSQAAAAQAAAKTNGPGSELTELLNDVLTENVPFKGSGGHSFIQGFHCTGCDFQVMKVDGFVWRGSVEYMFLRNNYPNVMKLRAKLEKKAGCCAYCCQCSSKSADVAADLADVADGLRWRQIKT